MAVCNFIAGIPIIGIRANTRRTDTGHGTSRAPSAGMADPNWRRPPSSSGGGVPFGVPKVQQQQQQERVPTNGGHGSQFPAPTQPTFHSGSGITGRVAHAPQGGTFAPPSQSSLVGKKHATQFRRCLCARSSQYIYSLCNRRYRHDLPVHRAHFG